MQNPLLHSTSEQARCSQGGKSEGIYPVRQARKEIKAKETAQPDHTTSVLCVCVCAVRVFVFETGFKAVEERWGEEKEETMQGLSLIHI